MKNTVLSLWEAKRLPEFCPVTPVGDGALDVP